MTPAHLATAGALLYGARWQAELARALGVSRETVRLWANGTVPIRADVPATLADLLARRQAAIRVALAHLPASGV